MTWTAVFSELRSERCLWAWLTLLISSESDLQLLEFFLFTTLKWLKITIQMISLLRRKTPYRDTVVNNNNNTSTRNNIDSTTQYLNHKGNIFFVKKLLKYLNDVWLSSDTTSLDSVPKISTNSTNDNTAEKSLKHMQIKSQ